jgi:uncharacterized protein YgiM (DUF1202 family)
MNHFSLSYASIPFLFLVTGAIAQDATSPAEAAPAPTDAAAADAPAPSGPGYVGILKGDNVYLRSGPDTNYYPISKLKLGSQVRVIGEKHGWLQISPPKGCFSFVDKTFVDTGSDGKGVINGDRVWVRAGSLLPDHSRMKYAKQVRLDKGAVVHILGETDDGFYKIAPPEDVAGWISSQFITRAPDAAPFTWDGQAWIQPAGESAPIAAATPTAAETESEDDAAPIPAQALTLTAQIDTPARAPANAPASTLPKAEITAVRSANQTQIAAIEKDLDVELQKKLEDRNLNPFIPRFQAIARQDKNVDEVSVLYAQNRIQQLQDQLEAQAAVQRVNALAGQILETRQRSATLRETVLPVQKRDPRQYDVRGMLAKSFVFTSPVGPKRYRIVDPASRPAATLAYVEIPEGKSIDDDLLLGRYVGVRASGRRIQQGVVRPVPVFLIDEVELLGADDVKVSGPAGADDPPTLRPKVDTTVAAKSTDPEDTATITEEGSIPEQDAQPE